MIIKEADDLLKAMLQLNDEKTEGKKSFINFQFASLNNSDPLRMQS
jgi:hypothetical protein